MRVRVGLAVHPDDENATGLVDDLAYGETARAMHATPDGELVLAVSEAFHALVADRTVRFPPASAYRSATANRADGPTCWVAVAGQAVCPDVPDETDAGRQGEGNQPSEALRRGGGDEYHTTVQRAKVVKIGHIGPRYEERR